MSEKGRGVVGRINACQRWILIGSQEPRIAQMVLLSVGDGIIVLGMYAGKNKWRYLGGSIKEEVEALPMTHWMPLPHPPTE